MDTIRDMNETERAAGMTHLTDRMHVVACSLSLRTNVILQPANTVMQFSS